MLTPLCLDNVSACWKAYTLFSCIRYAAVFREKSPKKKRGGAHTVPDPAGVAIFRGRSPLSPQRAKHGSALSHSALRRQTHECVCACNMFDLVKNNFSVGILNVGDLLALRVRYQRWRSDITSEEASFQTGREQPQRQHQVGDMVPMVAGGRQGCWWTVRSLAVVAPHGRFQHESRSRS